MNAGMRPVSAENKRPAMAGIALWPATCIIYRSSIVGTNWPDTQVGPQEHTTLGQAQCDTNWANFREKQVHSNLP